MSIGSHYIGSGTGETIKPSRGRKTLIKGKEDVRENKYLYREL